MVSKHMEHASLVCSSSVSKAKGHRDVAVHAKRGDERSRELVGLFHLDLVVTGVCIKKKDKSSHPVIESTILSICGKG